MNEEKTIPYIMNEGENLTVIINGKPLTMDSTHPAFREAVKSLKDSDYEKLEELFDVEKAVENYFYEDGNIKVADGSVFYKEEAIHNYTVDKILSFMRGGHRVEGIVKFLEKLMLNPSRRAIEELYRFLEHQQMPINKHGNFMAYKGVREDYTDWHSGHFDNSIGSVLEMTRNQVCDDANLGCSSGFHAGTWDYAQNYGNGGHLLLVEISPTDVVSVPHDSDCQKLRTCKYKVVKHCMGKIKDPYYEDRDEDEDDDGDFSPSQGNGYDHRDVDDCDDEEELTNIDLSAKSESSLKSQIYKDAYNEGVEDVCEAEDKKTYDSGYKAGIADAKKHFSGNSDNPKTAKTMTVAALQAAKQKRGNNGRFC